MSRSNGSADTTGRGEVSNSNRNCIMKNFTKPPGISTWVTISALISFVIGSISGVMATFGYWPAAGQGFAQNFDQDVYRAVGASWGARTLGLGVIFGVAMPLKSSSAYVVALVGGLGRDRGGIPGELNKTEPVIGIIVGTLVFFIVGMFGIIASYRAAKGIARMRINRI